MGGQTCVHLFCIIVNWIFWGFKLLVGQKKQYESVNLGPEKMWRTFLHNFLTFYGAFRKIFGRLIKTNECFSTCMLVIRNKMPPTARRERAGKSRLDKADRKRKKKGKTSISSCNILLLDSFSLDSNGLRERKTKGQRNVVHLESRRTPSRYP